MVAKGAVDIKLSDSLDAKFGQELLTKLANVFEATKLVQTEMSKLGKIGPSSLAGVGVGATKLSTALSTVNTEVTKIRTTLDVLSKQVKKDVATTAELAQGYREAAISLETLRKATRSKIEILKQSGAASKEAKTELNNLIAEEKRLTAEIDKVSASLKKLVPEMTKVNSESKKFVGTTKAMQESLARLSTEEIKHRENVNATKESIKQGAESYKTLVSANKELANNLKTSVAIEEKYISALKREQGAQKTNEATITSRKTKLASLKSELKKVEESQRKYTEAQEKEVESSKKIAAEQAKLVATTSRLEKSYASLTSKYDDLTKREEKSLSTSKEVVKSLDARHLSLTKVISSIEQSIASVSKGNKQDEQSKKTLTDLNSQLDKYQKEQDEVVQSLRARTTATKKVTDEGKKEASSVQNAVKAYDRLLRGYRNTSKELKLAIDQLNKKKRLNDDEVKELKILNNLYSNNATALRALTTAHQQQGQSSTANAATMRKLSQAALLAGGNISRLSFGLTALKDIGPKIAAGFVGVLAALKALELAFDAVAAAVGFVKDELVSSVKEFSEFERIIFGAVAVAGETSEAFFELGDAAKQTALDFTFSSKEIAQGFITLGQAGFDTTESLASIRSVAELAQATFSKLASSADLVTTTVRAFGLEISESDRLAQLFAAAINNSKTTLDGLRTSFNFVAVSASQIGLSVEETTAALGTLNNAGLKFSTAATGLRGVLGKLLAPTAKFKEELQKVGLTIEDVDPRVQGISTTLRRLRDAGFDVQSAYAGLDKRIAASASALISNVDAFDELQSKITDTTDATINAALQMSSLAGKTTILRNTVENLRIGVGEELSPALKDLIDNITDLLESNSDLADSFVNIGQAVLDFANFTVLNFDRIESATKDIIEGWGGVADAAIDFAKFAPFVSGLIAPFTKLKNKIVDVQKSVDEMTKSNSKAIVEAKKLSSSNKVLAKSYKSTVAVLEDINSTNEDRRDSVDSLIDILRDQGESEESISEIYQAQEGDIDNLISTLENLRLKKEEAAIAADFTAYTESIFNANESLGQLAGSIQAATVEVNRASLAQEKFVDQTKFWAEAARNTITIDEDYRSSVRESILTIDALARSEAQRLTALVNQTGNIQLAIDVIKQLSDARVGANESEKIALDLRIAQIGRLTESVEVHKAASEALGGLTEKEIEFREAIARSNLDLDAQNKRLGEAKNAFREANDQIKNIEETMAALRELGADDESAFNALARQAVNVSGAITDLKGEFEDLTDVAQTTKEKIAEIDKATADSLADFSRSRRQSISDETSFLLEQLNSREISTEEYLSRINGLEAERTNFVEEQVLKRSELIIESSDALIEAEKEALVRRLESEETFNDDVIQATTEFTELYLDLQKKKRDATSDIIELLEKEGKKFRDTFAKTLTSLDKGLDDTANSIETIRDVYRKASGDIVSDTGSIEGSYKSLRAEQSKLNRDNKILQSDAEENSRLFKSGAIDVDQYSGNVDTLEDRQSDLNDRQRDLIDSTVDYGSELADIKDDLSTSEYEKYKGVIKGTETSIKKAETATKRFSEVTKKDSTEAVQASQDKIGAYREKLDDLRGSIGELEGSQQNVIKALEATGIELGNNANKFAEWAARSTEETDKVISKLNDIKTSSGAIDIVIRESIETKATLENVSSAINDISDKAVVSVKVEEDPESKDDLREEHASFIQELSSLVVKVFVEPVFSDEFDKLSEDSSFVEKFNASGGGRRRWGGPIDKSSPTVHSGPSSKKSKWMLEKGEFVLGKSAVQALGSYNVGKMNRTGEGLGDGVAKFKRGGQVGNGRYGGGDRVPALLEEGEYVIRKESVRSLGLQNLEAMNSSYNGDMFAKMQFGGLVRGLGIKSFVKDIVDSALSSSDEGVVPDLDRLISFAVDGAGDYVQNKESDGASLFLQELKDSGPESLFEQYSLYRDAFIGNKRLSPGSTLGLDQLNSIQRVINGYFRSLRDELSRQYNVSLPAPRVDLTHSSTDIMRINEEFLRKAAGSIADLSPLGFNLGGEVSGVTDSVNSMAAGTVKALSEATGQYPVNLGPQVKQNEVPALLEAGEYVLNKDIVSRLGLANLKKLNAGKMYFSKYHDGGLVSQGGSTGMPSASEVNTSNLNLKMDVTFSTLDQNSAQDFIDNTLMPKLHQTIRLQGGV